MTKLLQGKKVTNCDFEIEIEEFEKRIKLVIQPGEMKACIEHFRKEAKNKLTSLPPQEPLIKVKWNCHLPFFGEALEYMKEFHKKYSTNDLYDLPRAYQESIDLALTSLDAEQIIQKWSNLGMKARFQHIRKASVLDFNMDLYTDLNPTDFPFSLDELQYLWHHFEVFSAVSLFGLMIKEMERVTRLDAYLDIRNAHIAYQEQTRKALQT